MTADGVRRFADRLPNPTTTQESPASKTNTGLYLLPSAGLRTRSAALRGTTSPMPDLSSQKARLSVCN